MNKEIVLVFSNHLRQLRKKHKLTQEKLAELSDVDYKHIQKLEGKNPYDVKLSTLNKLAKAFNLSLSKFLDFK
jgi:transcriptional regulator with XRE-family HTH domain